MSTNSFGVDFGQKVDLTASIRNILRNYPEGTSILKVVSSSFPISLFSDHRNWFKMQMMLVRKLSAFVLIKDFIQLRRLQVKV